jgi:hypothetical protein
MKQLGALRRHVKAHVELIVMRVKPIDERFGIEIRNRPKTKGLHE